ncbi:hypothetical protein H6503_02385 [Candidatus Woesearchaeota archaeon]|nr:hypothetical protein [Candidatus Woesearchaeota archaeon]
MKPFYNIGYSELFTSFYRGRLSRFLLAYTLFGLMFILVLVFFLNNKDSFFIMGLFVICVISMLPLRIIPWFGFFDMNTLLTSYAAMAYGLPAGLLVGTASLIGIINSGEVDNNLLFDLFASYIVAIIASLFTLQFYVPVVAGVAVIYATICFTFHKICGTLDFMNMTWISTNLLWVLLVLYKIMPLLGLA